MIFAMLCQLGIFRSAQAGLGVDMTNQFYYAALFIPDEKRSAPNPEVKPRNTATPCGCRTTPFTNSTFLLAASAPHRRFEFRPELEANIP